MLSTARRLAASVSLVALATATLAPVAAGASGIADQVTVPGPTTTIAPPATTLPPPAATTTTSTTRPKSSTTTTTVKGGPPATGVPSVPVGGPPTTKAPKTAKPGPPPPPPNPDPILSQVQSDLAQLTAIGDYRPAQGLVTAGARGVTLAAAKLQSAQNVLSAAQHTQLVALDHSKHADGQLRALAIAAYTGLGYATPEAGPQGVGTNSLGTVTTPGGLSGIEAIDAEEMLRLVSKHARRNVADTGHVLAQTRKVTARAQAAYNRAQGGVASAEAALLASQQTLKIVTEAATTPGAAATIDLLSIPGTSPGGLLPGAAAGLGIPGLTPAPTVGADPVTTTTTPGSRAPATTAAPTTTTTIPTLAAVAAATGQLTGTVNAAVTVPPPISPSILGTSVMNGSELAAWFATTNHKANTTVPIAKLAQAYQAAGKATGVRFDLAFAQSVIETGYFSFPSFGQLTPKDNNFAGIGACDSCAHGWSFPDAKTGVGAQLELLEAYASTKPVQTPLLRGAVGVGGCCPTWMALAGKWASSLVYGISIMTLYDKMLTWVIPQRLVAAGLIAPTETVAKGPSLAPLPGAPAIHNPLANTPLPGATPAH